VLGHPGLRVLADLAGLAVLAGYLTSPALFAHGTRPRGRHVRPRTLIGSF
jgi:hypothetical protein